MDRLRKVAKEKNRNVAFMLETTGPELRSGYYADNATAISLTKGEHIIITTDFAYLGDRKKISINYSALPEIVDSGNTILLDRGSCVLTVLSSDVANGEVTCRIENSAVVEEYRNVNIPGVEWKDVPTITEKDEADITNFGVPYGVDFVGITAVRRAEDVRTVRRMLGEKGQNVKLISKIENRQSLVNLREIVKVSDGIMIMIGALGRELEPQKILMVQRFIFRECRIGGKPVIAATCFLRSMIANSSRPTRQECGDVAMAIVDGADGITLGDETALGRYPVEAVRTMVHLVSEAETAMDYDKMYIAIRNSTLLEHGKLSSPESVANSAVRTAYDIGAKLILVLSHSGATARQIAKYCPVMPIIVLTPSEMVARQCFGMFRGVYAFKVEDLEDTDRLIRETVEEVVSRGVAKEGDTFVIVCGGSRFERGSTNQVKVDVVKSHYWDEPGEHMSSAQMVGMETTDGCVIS